MVIAIASPAHFTMRRLAQLFRHEVRHLQGFEHGHMTEEVLYSLGETPAWAKGLRIRYEGRAPSQL